MNINDKNIIEITDELSTEFEISKEHGYFRLTVVGLDGKRATTNAYFPEDLD